MKRSARLHHRKALCVLRQEKIEKNLWKNWLQFFIIVPIVFLFVVHNFWTPQQAFAASGINQQINFQGKLVDNNGLNVADNTYTVVFSLYNVSSGGSATWTETDSVSTLNGVFQVALGAGTPFPGNVDFNSDTWYLGIKVGSDSEMAPRIRFSAVPYAFNAAALDGVVATNSASQFTITGATNSPLTLTVNGSLTLGSTITPTSTGALTVQSNGANALTLDTGGAAAVTIGASSNAVTIGNASAPLKLSRFGTQNGVLYISATDGTVSETAASTGTQCFVTTSAGVAPTWGSCSGSTSLQSVYNVGQTIDLSQAGTGLIFGTGLGTQNVTIAPNAGGQAGLVINDQGTGAIFTASASGTTKLVLSHAGNLGVGSSNPQQALTLGTTSNFGGEMAAPTGVTSTQQATGSIPNGTYFYVVTASDGTGETVKSSDSNSCVSQNGGGLHACLITWTAVVGATQYKVYRSQTAGVYSGGTFVGTSTTTSYTDTAVSTTAGDPPTSTTAYVNKLTYSGASWLLGGKLGIGTSSPLARLHVSGGETGGNAAAVVDQIGASTNDILTGSASGSTKFAVGNSGTIKIAGGQSSDIDTLTNATTLTIGGTSQNGLTLGRSGSTTTINGSALSFGVSSWTVAPTISGLITASSGVSVASGQSYTGAGAVTVSSGGTNTALTLLSNGSGNIILGQNSGTGTVLITPNAGGQAALIIKDQGSGDLLSASAGATTKFIVHNDGSIQTIGANATADLTTITAGNGLTILPKANGSGAGGSLTLKGGNGSTTAGGLILDSGTGSSGSISIGTANATSITFGGSNNPTYAFNGTGAVSFQGTSLTLGNNSTATIQTTSNAGLNFLSSGSGNITLGQNSGTGTVVVQPNAGGQAALIINKQFTSGDILSASDSGVPVFTVAQAAGTAANGFTFAGSATNTAVSEAATGSDSNVSMTLDAKGTGTVTINGTATGGVTLGRATTITTGGLTISAGGTSVTGNSSITGVLGTTSTSSTALTVASSGSNYGLEVDESAASAVTGLKVGAAAAGNGLTLSEIGGNTDENLVIGGKGAGTVTVGGTVSSGNIILGTLSNGLNFSTTTGPTYTGNARPAKQIVLSAEYAGAVLTASNSAAISGNITSDASPSATATYNFENYYMWAATALGGLQSYTVAVRVTLPKDFSAWASGNAITIAYNTAFNDSSLNALDVYLYNNGDSSGTPVAFSIGNKTTSKTWGTIAFTGTQLTSGAQKWGNGSADAGKTAVFYLTMKSSNTVNYVQVGDITLNYLAAF